MPNEYIDMSNDNNNMTYEEFLKIDAESDDNLEFIDGQIYVMASPMVIHQRIVRRLAIELDRYFDGKECEIFISPLDVVLKENTKTHRVQPDLMIICGKDKPKDTDKNFEGMPSMIIEILSPSTIRKDLIVKMDLYMRLGLKEYWIVSPQNLDIQIFNNLENEPMLFYNDRILKSKIFPDLEIDLKKIFKVE